MDALQRLGIDGWSLVLYLVNYGILFFVLGKFIYKPLTKAMDARSKSIRGNLEEAERLKIDFQTEMDRRTKENDEYIKSMQLELMHARTDAEDRAKTLISDAEKKREELITQAYSDVDSMKARIVSEVEQELLEKIEKIALAAMSGDAIPRKAVSDSVKHAWSDVKSTL